MSDQRVVWRRLTIAIAGLAALAVLAVGAVSACTRLFPFDERGLAQSLGKGFQDMFADMFCPKVDAAGASIWVQAFPRYDLVVVTSTQDKSGPSLLAGERTIAPTGPGMMSVEVGAAANGLWSIAFDRPPMEGDSVDLSFRKPPLVAGKAPPTTYVDPAPFAAARYSYRFTGGRFVVTAATPQCKGR